ncbi:MAG: type II 3-dehydroquinate dehydratase [Gammaproteobacteria bacterium]|nr:type II 3-dehydroquinate dehydratase [Gammaproteobacteria bacterium]
MSKILVLNGPNLNLLGVREPNHYGSKSLDDINNLLKKQTKKTNNEIECFQSNAEFQLIEKIHHAYHDKIDFIIINPAAFTHTSVALRDALLAVNIPFIELHLSNVYKRESFRHTSFFSDIAIGVISGLGHEGYEFALQYALNHIKNTT